MPMYEYQCSKCTDRFEELVMNESDEADLVCPACGSAKVSKVLSSFSVGAGSSSARPMASCPSTGAPCGKAGGGFS